MNKNENIVGEIFADVEEVVRARARIERDAACKVATSGVAQLRHKYASSVCKTVLHDIKCVRQRYIDDTDVRGEPMASPAPSADSVKRIAELIREADLAISREESEAIALYLMRHGLVLPIYCRQCKHGQQCGELGVICEYNQDEYRPYNSYCSDGEVRTFEEEEE